MRILITYGSKLGGTEGIARMLGAVLSQGGVETQVLPPEEVDGLDGFDAVVVGGALYMFRWHRKARRFVKRHAEQLSDRPVWFFSSGPLEPVSEDVPPIPQVKKLMQRVGARGHRTFGGRLEKDARGFLARNMARQHAGDWRDPEQITRWGQALLEELGGVRPTAPGAMPLEPRAEH